MNQKKISLINKRNKNQIGIRINESITLTQNYDAFQKCFDILNSGGFIEDYDFKIVYKQLSKDNASPKIKWRIDNKKWILRYLSYFIQKLHELKLFQSKNFWVAASISFEAHTGIPLKPENIKGNRVTDEKMQAFKKSHVEKVTVIEEAIKKLSFLRSPHTTKKR